MKTLREFLGEDIKTFFRNIDVKNSVRRLSTGTSGSSGTAGTTGTSGTSGNTGTSGTAGTSGTSGAGGASTFAIVQASNLALAGFSTVTYAALTGLTTTSATIGIRQIAMPMSGTFKSMTINFKRPSSGTGTATFTLNKNGVDTSLTVSDSTTDGAYAILTATTDVSFVAGDLMTLKTVSTLSGAAGEMISSAFEVES